MPYGRGYDRQDTLDLYAFIDWLMGLSRDLESQFHEEFTRSEAEKSLRHARASAWSRASSRRRAHR